MTQGGKKKGNETQSKHNKEQKSMKLKMELEKFNETKSWLFQKANNIDEPLPKQAMGEKFP